MTEEIEITPQMIEAGLAVLIRNVESLDAIYKTEPSQLVREIYSRMREVGAREAAEVVR